MKYICKRGQPAALQTWRKNNKSVPENLVYGRGGFPILDVLKGLIDEQQGLCAYTMLRIGMDSAHVEHLKPQKECRKTDQELQGQGRQPLREDVAWSNLVACHPSPQDPRAVFGAQVKGDWWNEHLFVSPLVSGCQDRFRYELNGHVSGRDAAAQETVTRLALDEPSLTERRKMAVRGAGLHPTCTKPLTEKGARQLINRYRQVPKAQKLPEFVGAIIQAAEAFIEYRRCIREKKRYRQQD